MCDSSLTNDEVASVGRLLLNVGPALEHLELSLWSVRKHSSLQHMSMASNSSLRTITFDGLVVYNQDSRSNTASWTSVILSQITSHVVEQVVFRIWYESITDIEALHLDQVEEILKGRQFRRLREVVFELNGKRLYHGTREDAHKDGMREIKGRMKILNALGLLVFR